LTHTCVNFDYDSLALGATWLGYKAVELDGEGIEKGREAMPMIAWWILMERNMENVEEVARSIFSLYKLSIDVKSEKTGLYRAKEYLRSAFKNYRFNVNFEDDFRDRIGFTILP
jgi:hypothetical protein